MITVNNFEFPEIAIPDGTVKNDPSDLSSYLEPCENLNKSIEDLMNHINGLLPLLKENAYAGEFASYYSELSNNLTSIIDAQNDIVDYLVSVYEKLYNEKKITDDEFNQAMIYLKK